MPEGAGPTEGAGPSSGGAGQGLGMGRPGRRCLESSLPCSVQCPSCVPAAESGAPRPGCMSGLQASVWAGVGSPRVHHPRVPAPQPAGFLSHAVGGSGCRLGPEALPCCCVWITSVLLPRGVQTHQAGAPAPAVPSVGPRTSASTGLFLPGGRVGRPRGEGEGRVHISSVSPPAFIHPCSLRHRG